MKLCRLRRTQEKSCVDFRMAKICGEIIRFSTSTAISSFGWQSVAPDPGPPWDANMLSHQQHSHKLRRPEIPAQGAQWVSISWLQMEMRRHKFCVSISMHHVSLGQGTCYPGFQSMAQLVVVDVHWRSSPYIFNDLIMHRYQNQSQHQVRQFVSSARSSVQNNMLMKRHASLNELNIIKLYRERIPRNI